jgi:hypothetical protein
MRVKFMLEYPKGREYFKDIGADNKNYPKQIG